MKFLYFLTLLSLYSIFISAETRQATKALATNGDSLTVENRQELESQKAKKWKNRRGKKMAWRRNVRKSQLKNNKNKKQAKKLRKQAKKLMRKANNLSSANQYGVVLNQSVKKGRAERKAKKVEFKQCILETCFVNLSEDCQRCKNEKKEKCKALKGNKHDKKKCFKENSCFETCFDSSQENDSDDEIFVKSNEKNVLDNGKDFRQCKQQCRKNTFRSTGGNRNRQMRKGRPHKNGRQIKKFNNKKNIDQEQYKTCMGSTCFKNFFTSECARCKTQCFEESSLSLESMDENESVNALTKTSIRPNKPFKAAQECKKKNNCTRKECKVVEGKKMKDFWTCKRECFEGARNELDTI